VATHTSFPAVKQVNAGVLNIGYAEAGPPDGPPVILLHGWPYDIYSYVDVAPLLATKGYRVLVPYLRGYGSTQFLSSATFRNAQQAVVAVDIKAFMDALNIPKAIIGGFDWGARTADIMAVLWPERVKALVSVSGYLITNLKAQLQPLPPAGEYGWWYQFYFATDRGVLGYRQNTHDFNKLIGRPSHRSGTSTTRRSNAPRRPSAIPITSASSSTTTGGDKASLRATPNTMPWSNSCSSIPSSACLRSPSPATSTALGPTA
jgi:pimeloyl-ACP methyl ester carboxylesterase